ncbi:MAG: carboxypeptidase-like regulatory domain-containing protein [Candidatus Marinimicrobia bacterium]|jgi:hypothetical protein|nr:carboxypeptidase-like regulatory domain-containing protein [Candidatus Neomarinimicrobiota bacterium]MDD5061242.1 carboxypeptidase-like regulatory domain-containing protein [Candidatus Neomarinimicrobiota bacterium]
MKKVGLIIFAVLFAYSSCNLLDSVDKKILDISGKVSENGAAVGGAIVLLVESTDISEGLSLANGSLTDNAGNYIILDVDPGDYYVLAIDDQNDNVQFDSGTDQLGFHGVNPATEDFTPNKITIDKDDLEDIDIVDLYTL